MTGLDVVVTSYRTRELLRACLTALQNHAPQCPMRVVVVDNGSDDGSVAMVREQFPEVERVAFDENRGYGAATNHALRDLQSETALLLNADAEVTAGSIDTLLAYLDRRPQVGAVGPHQQNAAGAEQISCGSALTLPGEVVRWLRHRRVRVGRGCRRQPCGPVAWVSGSAMMIRREALRRAGLFDENFFLYFEDIDLCFRIAQAGLEIHYCPTATVIHHGGASAAAEPARADYQYRRSQLLFWQKHGSIFGRNLARAWVGLRSGWLLLGLRSGLLTDADGRRRQQQRRVWALARRGAP